MVELITCTDEEIKQAKAFANVYDTNNYGKNVLGVSHSEFIHFIFVGKLAELAVKRYFLNHNIDINYDGILEPCPDEHKIGADMILNYSNQEIDVKVAHLNFHKRILVREDQFRAHQHDIYIGTKCTDNRNVYIHGYIKGNELAKKKIQNFGYFDCRAEFLNNLSPINDIIQKAKIGYKI